MTNSASMIHASPKIDIWGGTNVFTIYSGGPRFWHGERKVIVSHSLHSSCPLSSLVSKKSKYIYT